MNAAGPAAVGQPSLYHHHHTLTCLAALAQGFTRLTMLALSDNPLTGSLGSLPPNLKALLIANTGLSGSLPAAWATMPSLGCIVAYGSSSLCGDLPEGLPCIDDRAGSSLGEHVALPLCLHQKLTCTWCCHALHAHLF